jgi:hypothetical protein
MGVSGMDFGIRKGLVDRGVSDADIGFNKSNGWVTIGDKDFIKAPKNYNGTTYTTEQDFNSAWNTHQKSNQQPDPNRFNAMHMNPSGVTGRITAASNPTPQAQAIPGYTPFNTNNPYDPKFDSLLSSLLNQANNPTPVDVNAIYASPQWAAYQQNAEKSAQQGIRAAQESMGASGFGRSTGLGERAQGIQNDATSYLNTQVLPQLMSQAQADKQQQLQNQMAVLGQLGNQQGVFDTRFNNANNLAIDQGQLTGKYLSPEARSTIDQIIGLGEAWKTGTPEQRAQFSAEANRLRGQLQALGVDPSQFGANLTTEQRRANVGQAGVATLDATNIMAQLTGKLPNGQKTSAQQQLELTNLWKVAEQTGKIPDALATLYGLPKGTQTQAAKEFALGYQLDERQTAASELNAQTSADSAASSKNNAEFDNLMSVWANSGKAPDGLQAWGIEPGEPYQPQKAEQAKKQTAEEMRTYFDSMAKYDDYGKLTNSDALKAAIVESPLSDYDVYQLFLRYNIPWEGEVPLPNQ